MATYLAQYYKTQLPQFIELSKIAKFDPTRPLIGEVSDFEFNNAILSGSSGNPNEEYETKVTRIKLVVNKAEKPENRERLLITTKDPIPDEFLHKFAGGKNQFNIYSNLLEIS